MGRRRSEKRLISGSRGALFTAILAAAMGAAGCSSGTVSAPTPRPIVVSSGERLRADTARIDSIYSWLSVQSRRIQEDPTFLIDEVPTARETEPWRTLTIMGDTARIQYDRAHPDITTAYDVYATYHLMKKMGKLEEWLPGHGNDEGYALERAILDRVADAWLLGRAAYDAPPYAGLDELIYAREAGYLDPYILVARASDFPEDKAKFEEANPGRIEEYRAWFKKIFLREPPGMRDQPAAGTTETK